MHGIDQHEPLLDAALLDRRLNLLCDVEVGAPRVRLEPELFTIGFHGRRSVDAHSAELDRQDASCIISLTPSIKPSAENHGVFGEGESIRLLRYIMVKCPSRRRPRPHARRDLHDFDFQPMPISSSVGAIWPRTIRERSSRRRRNYSGASRPTSHKLNDFTLSPAGCPTRLNAGTTAWPASIFFPILPH